uniref:Uncharacterized protein n=1 Tax=Pundamilia nyererei TaxID=303518 RepID=A0A3B4GSB4_9CICH
MHTLGKYTPYTDAIYAHMNTHRLAQNPGPKITSVSHIESSLQMEKSQAASSHVFDSQLLIVSRLDISSFHSPNS